MFRSALLVAWNVLLVACFLLVGVNVLLLVDCAVCVHSPVNPVGPGLSPVWGLTHPRITLAC